MNTDGAKKLMTPKQVSACLGVGVETLNAWRALRRYDLPYVKVGRLVRYREEDVMQFIESNVINTS